MGLRRTRRKGIWKRASRQLTNPTPVTANTAFPLKSRHTTLPLLSQHRGVRVFETAFTLSGSSQQPSPAAYTNVYQKNNFPNFFLPQEGLTAFPVVGRFFNNLRTRNCQTLRLIFGNLPKIASKNYFRYRLTD
jgi:hypothetical protein